MTAVHIRFLFDAYMKNNNFAEEYESLKALQSTYNEADEKNDFAAKEVAKHFIKQVMKCIEEKGTDYDQTFEDYKDARDCGNEYIDLSDNIWDEKVPALIESLRNLGIDHFTFSSTWSSAVETAWIFTENGYRLEGLIQINSTNRNWKTGEFEKKPAYVFSIQ